MEMGSTSSKAVDRRNYSATDRQNKTGAGSRDINGSPSKIGNHMDPRSEARPIATRPATFENIRAALGMMPGPGLVANAARMVAGYDPFSGPVGRTQMFSSDPPNRMGTHGNPAMGNRAGGAWLSGQQLREYQQLLRQRARAQAVISVPQEQVAYPAMQLQSTVPGRPAYGVAQPGYSFLAPVGTAAKASGYAGMPSLNPVGLPPQVR